MTFHWRCKVCGEEGFADGIPSHCGIRARELATISKESKKWFEDFLDGLEWSFVRVEDLTFQSEYFLDDPALLSSAYQAGKEMERILNTATAPTPDHFERYEPKSDHLRVSDLKKPKEIKEKLREVNKWRRKKIEPSKKRKKIPQNIELGHVFDEYLSNVTEKISEEGGWAPGSKVEFESIELGLKVVGTTDLTYDGIPVEMKTRRKLPLSSKNRPFKVAWRTNYLPQMAMYSHASGLDWMYLMLVSRDSGEFSIIPTNCKPRMDIIRNQWNQVMKDPEVVSEIEKYKKS